MGNMFCLKLRTKQVENVSVGVSALKFRLFRMSRKAGGTLKCILNIIFCLASVQQSKRIHTTVYILLSDKGEDRSTSKSESEHSERSSYTDSLIHQCI